MSATAIGGIVFACVFGGALLGAFLSTVMPKHHLSEDTKDLVRLATATIATMAALVVGLLIASAKSSFDGKDNEIRHIAAQPQTQASDSFRPWPTTSRQRAPSHWQPRPPRP
jgi:hypothetical protein